MNCFAMLGELTVMDNLISVLVVDDNVELAKLIKENLEQCGDIIVTGMAKDGLEAIDKIEYLKPDIVILDIVMPNLDGIGVLERINERRFMPRPIFLMVTAIGQDIFVKKAMELGADYFFMKPFDINILVSRIRQIYEEKTAIQQNGYSELKKISTIASQEANKDCLEKVISGMINSIGITPNIIGFHYLRDAVKLGVENPLAVHSVAKRIYPVIADKYNTTTRNVDRAIRCAIKGAEKKVRCKKTAHKLLHDLAGINKSNNTQLISFFVDKVGKETGLSQKSDKLTK